LSLAKTREDKKKNIHIYIYIPLGGIRKKGRIGKKKETKEKEDNTHDVGIWRRQMLKSRKASQEACKTKREKKIKKKKKIRKRSYYVGDFNTMHQDKRRHYSYVRQEETEKREEKDKKHLMLSCFDTMKKLDK